MEMKASIMAEVVTPTLGYVARDRMSNPQSTYIEIIEQPSNATVSRLKEINSIVAKSRSDRTEATHGMQFLQPKHTRLR
jgi:hypothetical protein